MSPSLSRFRTLSALLFVTLTGCHHEHVEHEGRLKLPVTKPLRKSTELTKEFVAQIRAFQHIELRSMEKGYVQGIFVDEGQHVPKGARMFQVMPMIYQAEAERARAEAELAGIEFSNTKMLADKNVVSPNELALARAKLSKAEAEVSLAATHRALTEIHAPFDGIMGRFEVRMGSLVDEGDLLTTLSDNSKVWVYFNVSEAEYLHHQTLPEDRAPDVVKLRLANGQLFDQPGKVETIEADFNNETGNVAFRAAFPNPKGLLRHGQTGTILLTETMDDAMIIPQKATFEILDKRFIFVVDDKHVVHARPIAVAAELPQVYVVASGLAENDEILVEGLTKVRDGATIDVEFQPPTEVLARLQVAAE